METFTLVRPEHLNHKGYLFGGQMLRWVDEFAWLVAAREFPVCTFVTRAMDDVQFRHQVDNGAILRFSIERNRQGRTSVTYGVEVFAQSPGTREEALVFSTHVTFVNLSSTGEKTPVA